MADQGQGQDQDNKGKDRICVICFGGEEYGPLIKGCHCRQGYYHFKCMADWMGASKDSPCASCKQFYYNDRIGNSREALIKWQKVVNSYRLRVLIELSKKDEDADLNTPLALPNI